MKKCSKGEAKLIRLLTNILNLETCYFQADRKWKKSCAEENGRGFTCFMCQAEEYLNSLGIKIDRR